MEKEFYMMFNQIVQQVAHQLGHLYGCSGESKSSAKVEQGSKPLQLVFGSPVLWPEKEHNQTGPRPQKTGPAVWSFHFWDVKTAKNRLTLTGLK